MASSSPSESDPPLTAFQSRVYGVVHTIPKGSVRSYGSIAKELQTSARAVGTAMGRNPFGPSDRVPCHRVVASDRSIGGFGHTWGEDQPKVQRKRRLLEAEGIIFDEEGNGNKIRKEFFVESASMSGSATTTKPKGSGIGKGTKKRKMDEPQSKQSTGVKRTSKYFDTVSEEKLKQEILNLLEKRQPGKTCCPSEIPRGLSKRGEIPSSTDWRSLMSPTRDAACSLAREGRVDVMQKGNVIGTEEEYRGPIRLRLCEE